jgi:tripeptide aminopeptidase
MINEQRLINTFLELVRIDSPSGEEAEIAALAAEKLRALGAGGQVGALYNVTGKLPGHGVPETTSPLFLNAHLDNVPPARGITPRVSDGRITSDGTTVLGADDLAGVAAILEVIQSLNEDGSKHVPLEIAFTTQEETGLMGARALDLSGFSAKEGVVLDEHGPVGKIVLGTPTLNLIDVRITGRAAHSGLEPEKGISAIRVAAEAIKAMKLGRIDHETTANIGIIRGGTARNAVPENVELVGEVRSRKPRKLDRVTAAMRVALEGACTRHGAQLDFQARPAFDAFRLKRGDRFVRRVASAIAEVGREPRYELAMGGYDANIWNAKGIRAVAISVGPEQVHTTSEYILVEDLVKTAQLVERLTLV